MFDGGKNSCVMTRTKKQHYVPQFLLRRFASALRKNPKLWALDKATGDVRLSSIHDIGHENYFYEHCADDGNRVELEGLMAGIDSIGAQIVSRILTTGVFQLSLKDFVWLSYFVACQMLRTPMIRNEMENLRQMIIYRWGPNVRAGDDQRTVGEYGPKDSKLSSLLAIQNVPEFAKILQTKVWTLSEAPSGNPFVIGDNPVTRHNMIDRWPRGNLGLNNKGIELYLPLSPTYCIHIICPDLALTTLGTEALSEEYAAAIADGVPVRLRPENVDFVNSQQVIWAERYVFARQKEHLSMPLDMLRTNPELRSGPGVRQRPEDV